MRDRHFPRLCRTCQAPMARQQDTCWRCGAQWASEHVPRTILRTVGGRASGSASEQAEPALTAGIGAHADADRWTNEGGSFDPEVADALRAAV